MNNPSVDNITRKSADDWKNPMGDNTIWISINEPELEVTKNKILDSIPNLKLAFWDLTNPVPMIGTSNFYYPPSEYDARKIVDFILEHKGKNVIVNCKAGKCRSGAVAQFCHEYLGYDWTEAGKNRALPNPLLFKLMVEYYGEPKKVVVNDKRRIKL